MNSPPAWMVAMSCAGFVAPARPILEVLPQSLRIG
jgi:hypothetical protein